MASSGFADTSSTLIGTGTLTITTGDHDPVTIAIDNTNNSLSGLRDSINSANAGVTASIINDGAPGTPYRLLIKANETGTANSFTLVDGISGGQALELVRTQAGSDANFTLNGVAIAKSSNTVSDVVSGVTFTLKELTSAPVTLSVEKDVDSIVEAVNGFLTAYNAVNSFINSQFRYDPSTEKPGVLSGDSTLRRIQSTLQNQITQRVANPFTSFSAVGQAGLEFNRDGSLTLDERKFREALTRDFTGVAALFLGDGDSAEGYGGILMNLFSVLDGITDPLSGPIHNATDGLNRNIDSLQDRIGSYQERLEKRREMLTLEYGRADEALRLMTVLQAQFSSQISALTG
jgi:flagellar hook-associated protein 2